MLKALVFDFDGLMVDTEGTSLLSWQELYGRYGQKLPLDLWVTLIGTWDAAFNPTEYLAGLIGRPLSAEELAERYAREIELASREPLLPGVSTHMDAADAAGIPMAVASSSSRSWVEGHLGNLGIRDRFVAVCTRDDVLATKPDPELYVLATSLLGVSADSALAYEDSVHGLVAAKAAGLRCVAVPGPLTAGGDFSRADMTLTSLADIDPVALWSRF